MKQTSRWLKTPGLLFLVAWGSLKAFGCATLHKGKADHKVLEDYLSSLSASREPAAVPKMKKNNAPGAPTNSLGLGAMPTLPTLENNPWGGGSNKPESILANATSQALNEAWSDPNTRDAVVSVPVKMLYSKERPYLDGQTNATLSFGDWNSKRPQLVATLKILSDGTRSVKLRFDSGMALSVSEVEVLSFNPNQKIDTLKLSPGDADAKIATWIPAPSLKFGDVTQARNVWVRPKTWTSWFPIDFRAPVYTKGQLLTALGPGAELAGASYYDPLAVTSQGSTRAMTPLDTLFDLTKTHQLPLAWYQDYYPVPNIHAEFPMGAQKKQITAVGQGWTWVAQKSAQAPFKTVYTCFDKRDPGREVDAGVPSGGGWHEIGDAAETIINNLETQPIVVGFATGIPWPKPPMNQSFSWDLTDVTSVKWLAPGTALVTPAGDQTWREDEKFRSNGDTSGRAVGNGGGRNYHWFYFHHSRPICTQEWVHECVPGTDPNLGLRCKGAH